MRGMWGPRPLETVEKANQQLDALAKLLENMTETEILRFNIPTGIPIVYQLDKQMTVIDRQFLADDTKLRAAIDEVVQQTPKN